MSQPLKTVLAAACIMVAFASVPGAQQTKPSREIVSSTISGFNIVLVIGETQRSGSTSAEDLPGGAARALKDMSEFLPYKHYRVLDAQWTSCCAPRNTTVAGRLQGVVVSGRGSQSLVPRGYGFMIFTSTSQQSLPIRFVLNVDEPFGGRDGASSQSVRAMERERQDLQAEIETLGMQIKSLQGRIEVGTAPATELRPMQDRYASLQRRLADMEPELAVASSGGSRPIMDSSFTMEAGETVVVGTSRLGGDKALIAIVTAVRKK
jgi:hypothetical protein